MLVEVGARTLLVLALAVAADAESEQEVDQQHGQATSHRHGEPFHAQAGWIDDKHYEPREDHHRSDAVAQEQQPDGTSWYRLGALWLSHKLPV